MEQFDSKTLSEELELQIKQHIRKRGVFKGIITRIQNFTDVFSSENGDLNLLQRKYDNLIETWQKYDDVQSFLELHDAEHDEDRIIVENIVDNLCSKLQGLLNYNKRASSEKSSSSKTRSSCSNKNPSIVLPQIDLPKFNGQYENWLAFSEFFKVVVHENDSLTQIQKFHYLLSSLVGNAKQLIKNLSLTPDNYTVAWNLLQSRYANKRLIAAKHAHEIIDLPRVQRESANEISNFTDTISSNINALKALDLSIPHPEFILIQMLTHKLDSKTAGLWESNLNSNTFPSLEQFIEFLEKRRQVLESSNALDLVNKVTGAKQYTNQPKKGNTSCHVSTNITVTKVECIFCKQKHALHKCYKFIKAAVGSRLSFVKQQHLCFNCLSTNHMSRDCSNQRRCKICNGLHHSLLHIARSDEVKDANNENKAVETSNSYFSLKTRQTTSVLLATAIVNVKDIHGCVHNCRAMLDAGSQANFVTESLAQRLKLKRSANELSICGINSISACAKHTVDVNLSSNYSDFVADLTCYVLPNITGNLPSSPIDITHWNLPRDIYLADSNFHTPAKIDILIGAELFMNLLLKGQMTMGENYPVLQETRLGWIIAGRLTPTKLADSVSTSLCVINDMNVQHQLQRFWEIEELNSTTRSKEDQFCEKHFTEYTTRDNMGRFIVRLPQRQNCAPLGESLTTAERRFLQLERKLNKNPELRNNYVQFMKEYLRLGHMKPALLNSSTLKDKQPYYLPHHAVFKATSTTTKTRVVFDGSAKTSNGNSLNDILMVGPTIQQDIISIVLRFRTYIYAMTADITKMYRQISVDPDDYDLQRILWRESPQHEIGHYQLTTVTYGTAPASFLATRCLAQIASNHSQDYPHVAETIRSDFYVDDLQTGGDNLIETINLQQQIIEILSKYGLVLHKWCSNNEKLLESVPENRRETQLPFKFDSSDSVHTLGLIWDPSRDTLRYEINVKLQKEWFTKRNVLSTIASIYDPLGLLGPVIASYKIFMQQLWHYNLNWDDRLPNALHQFWLELYSQLPMLRDITIPRLIKSKGHLTDIQIHGFSDASENCYGACIYARSVNSEGHVSVHLICSKSRVAPVKQITLPRLELCAAMLLARLINKTLPALRLHVSKVFCWTDSTVVLSWLSATPTRWKTFVANRVSEIQDLTEFCYWNHVKTDDNPADILSRGASPLRLQNYSLWWNGPSWLQNDGTNWSLSSFIPAENFDIDARKQVVSLSIAQPEEELSLLFSSLPRMLRILAHCIRFIHNIRCPKSKNTSPLTVSELNSTLRRCIREVQNVHFGVEKCNLQNDHSVFKKSKIYSLDPFIDKDGCLRVGGRLENSSLNFDGKHPYIIPAKTHLTRLIIVSEHERLLHAGIQLLHSSLRQRYWIINARNEIRSIIHKCLNCFKFRKCQSHQLMGQLPRDRVQISRPFFNSGVDYAGPFTIRQGGRRSKKRIKCYVALFICLATKAIHLELVSDLTTEAFIAALRRFTSRRGISSNIYSDNGSNFVGANNLLRSFSKLLTSKDFSTSVTSYTSNQGIQWHFIPPSSPHFGGLWEAGVKSMKYHLRRIVGNISLTFEEFSTILTQIEACLNSRPICQLSSDPNDPQVLTPGHFLIGAPLNSLPEPDYNHVPGNRLNRWQLTQQCVQRVWHHWSRDYLNQLQQRKKWNTPSPNLQPGMLMLLKDDNTSPLQWRLATIEEIHPGPDGLVRVASVRTTSGVFKRPVHKLCLVPLKD